MTRKTYHGSCHCQQVRFQADIDLSKGTNRCNCTLCWKARAWFTIVPSADVRLASGEQQMLTYEWLPKGQTEHRLKYHFCGGCGVRLWATGDMPQLGGRFHAVHVPTLDDATRDEFAAAPLKFNDMLHDAPDRTPEDTRLL